MAEQNILAKNTGAGGNWLDDLFAGLYGKQNVNSFIKSRGAMEADKLAKIKELLAASQADPLGGEPLIDGLNNTGFGTTTKLMGNWIGDHKLKSAGIGALGAANIGGLLDNPYWGGQAIGGLAGGLGVPLIASKLGIPMSVSSKLMSGLAGGGLGSLFDKLREKQAEEQRYGGNY